MIDEKRQYATKRLKIIEDFEFIDDWEDRYRYVIEKGKAMDPLDDALKFQRPRWMVVRLRFGCTLKSPAKVRSALTAIVTR